MNKSRFQFPSMCAWCGLRSPTSKREVKLRSSTTRGSRRWTHIEFSAPICTKCESYAQKLDENDSKIRRVVIPLSFLLGFILSILLLMGDELVMIIILGPLAGVLIMGLIMLALVITGMDKRLRHQGAGDPPLEYASDTSDPCALYTSGTIRFHSEAYHAQFAALNPDIAWQPKS